MTRPRIAPLSRDQADEAQRELFDRFEEDQLLNLFTTMARHPKLMRSWLHLGGRLLAGGLLQARDREILILRSSARSGSRYEWGQHVALARTAGLSDDAIVACAANPPGPPLEAFDLVLVEAADELIDDHTLSDAVWERLRARFDDARMIEVTMLVGHYVMLAGLLNSARVQTEKPLPEIGAVV